MANTNPTALEQFKRRVKTLCNETKRGQTVFDLSFLSRVVYEIEQIENPKCGYREQLLYDLAYTQWSVEEIRQGKPWQHLISK